VAGDLRIEQLAEQSAQTVKRGALENVFHEAAHDERVYLPQLLMTESAIARARGEVQVADASIRRAIGEAREQEAPWLELLARVDLYEHPGATAEDRDALAALVGRLPEAGETTAVKKARALLEGTKPRPMVA